MSTQKAASLIPSRAYPRNRWSLRVSLVAMEVFVGLGAVFGGVEMVQHPLSPMGMTTELIDGSPFNTYTWPGVLLLALLGIAPLVLAIGVLAKVKGAVSLSGVFGVGLMAWICVQWVILPDRLWIQPLMFSVGLVVLSLSAVLHRQDNR